MIVKHWDTTASLSVHVAVIIDFDVYDACHRCADLAVVIAFDVYRR